MECHAVRGVLRARSLSLRAGPAYCSHLNASHVGAGCVAASDRRLYHQQRQIVHPTAWPSPRPGHLRLQLLAGSPLPAGRRAVQAPLQSRGIIISRVIEALREADVTSLAGLSRFILESTPVTAVSGLYEWTLAATGLPCAATLILCSAALQVVFNTPAIVYMTKWTTQKEKHMADMVAIKSSLMRAPNRESLLAFGRTHNDLTRAYGCQTYKLVMTVCYQVVHVTITSFGVRAFLMNQNIGAGAAMLPWGICLGFPDTTFILPIINAALNLAVVEVATWKKRQSDEGLKMTLKRASVPYKPPPLYLLNIRRSCTVPLVLIYGMVPSGLTLHWLVMSTCSLQMQILLTHRQTRRALKIPPCYFESDKPFRDFLQHLRKDVEILRKKP